jgi:activating signal cointegrator complex subunit 3
MYFGRLPPPIRDYVTDAKLAIDGSIRIIHALIDIAADKGYLESVINLCHIMQMIVQGMYINDSQFLNLPNFTTEMIKKLNEKEGIAYLCQLQEVVKEEGKLKEMFKKLDIKLGEEDLEEIEDAIKYIPDISFRVGVSAFDSEKYEKIENAPLKEGEEAQITVNLKRNNTKYPLAVQMERYSKIKDAGWWIIGGIESKNELLFVKKISFKDRLKREMLLNLPESFENNSQINVYLFSDSYIGIDQVNTIWLKPRPKQEGKK